MSNATEERLSRIESMLSKLAGEKDDSSEKNVEYNPHKKEFSPELREKYSKLILADEK